MIKKVLITSGPTLEPIDPVRYISNRSSGKTGYYLAYEARQRNIEEIVFVSGPVRAYPDGVELIKVETALEMKQAVWAHWQDADVIIMAAAVCDFKSVRYYSEKIKKNADSFVLELVRNPDILQELGQKKKKNQVLVGYAAETENIFENGQKKLREKKVDLLVLNEISAKNPAFDSDDNQVYLLTPRAIKKLEKMKKASIAVHIWNEILNIRAGNA